MTALCQRVHSLSSLSLSLSGEGASTVAAPARPELLVSAERERTVVADREPAGVDGASLRGGIELELPVVGDISRAALAVGQHAVVERHRQRRAVLSLLQRRGRLDLALRALRDATAEDVRWRTVCRTRRGGGLTVEHGLREKEALTGDPLGGCGLELEVGREESLRIGLDPDVLNLGDLTLYHAAGGWSGGGMVSGFPCIDRMGRTLTRARHGADVEAESLGARDGAAFGDLAQRSDHFGDALRSRRRICDGEGGEKESG